MSEERDMEKTPVVRPEAAPEVKETAKPPMEKEAAGLPLEKEKAGLPADFWAADITVSRYGVQKWSESD